MGATNAALIDPRSAMHVAFHEPQHQIQHLIGELIKGGAALPQYMQDASRIFRLLGDFGARNCPPEALEVSPQAKENAYTAYKLSRWEETAFYQGNLASVESNRNFMPTIAPKMSSWLESSPELENGISKESRDWAARFNKPEAPKSGAVQRKISAPSV